MRLTYQNIEALKSLNHGWNSAVLELLGVSWPPVKGWRRRIIGKEVTDFAYKTALEIRDTHLNIE